MKGIKTGGRVKGSKNVFTFDVKKRIQENVNEVFVDTIFKDIENIESTSERVKARIKVIEFFVPKPKDTEDSVKENDVREKLYIALALK